MITRQDLTGPRVKSFFCPFSLISRMSGAMVKLDEEVNNWLEEHRVTETISASTSVNEYGIVTTLLYIEPDPELSKRVVYHQVLNVQK